MNAGATVGAGACLAAAQFCVAAGGTILLLFLPALAVQAGLPAGATVRLPMMAAATVAAAAIAIGWAADRVSEQSARSGRRGRSLFGVTLVACGAFALLPAVAARGSGVGLVVLLGVWAASSSAWWVVPLRQVGRLARAASQPWLIGASLLGWGVAGAMAPSAAGAWQGVAPHRLFGIGGAALAMATLGIAAADRLLWRAGRAEAGPSPRAETVAPVADANRMPSRRTRRRGELAAAATAAFAAGTAFQFHVFVDSPSLYQRLAAPADLAYLTPVFWVGFGLFLLAAARLVERAGAAAVTAGGALVGAVVSLLAPGVGALQLLVNLQFIAGCAWACTALGAVAAALALGRTGSEGRFVGGLGSLFALAALVRLALGAAGSNALLRGAGTGWVSAGGGCVAALLVWAIHRRGSALRSPPR